MGLLPAPRRAPVNRRRGVPRRNHARPPPSTSALPASGVLIAGSVRAMAVTPGKATIRQVAALAGVSHQTVSRVLNGHASIRPATRDRVLEAIEELDYRPNSAARALATSRTNRIGVIVDAAVEYGPNSTLRGLERAARAVGYSVTSATVGDDDPLGPSVAFEHLMSQGIDALCVIAPRSSSLDRLRRSSLHMPALVVKAAQDDTFLTVSVDQELGAALAVRHLIDLGHRRIAHVAGPLDWLDAAARHRAWRKEIKSAGLDELDAVVGDWTAGFGYEVAHQSWSAPGLHRDLRRQRSDRARPDPRICRARHSSAGRCEHRRLRRSAGVEAFPPSADDRTAGFSGTRRTQRRGTSSGTRRERAGPPLDHRATAHRPRVDRTAAPVMTSADDGPNLERRSLTTRM